jgi:hypothetical protein
VTLTKPSADQLTPDPSERRASNNGFLSHHRASFGRSNSFGAADTSVTYPDKDDFHPDAHDASGSGPRAPFPLHDQRTIIFSNLSEKTTHKDLTNIIRGGRLLDIYLRNDRSATVSFVEGAADFLAYAKRNDIYVNTKRVCLTTFPIKQSRANNLTQLEIRWNDRQFRLPSHVANKIALGATRNIVVRNGASKNLTERGIRDDLEHIHNLVVVSVTISKGDVYISTNSVHNALFARTCMMSRSIYKGLKIEWYPDECAQALPAVRERTHPSVLPIHSQQQTTMKNRKVSPSNLYSLLDMDNEAETSDEGNDDDDDTTESQALPGFAANNGVSINWADAAVVA